jgi:ribosomal protein S18 acetylase RimI-like enzyme
MGLRLMHLEDQPQLALLWQAEQMISDLDYLQGVLAWNPNTCWVIEQEGQLIAAACGLYNGRHGILSQVAVLPEYRGQGYGKQIVLACVESLKRLGARRIRLFVRDHNEYALEFYRRLGFEVMEGMIFMGLP